MKILRSQYLKLQNKQLVDYGIGKKIPNKGIEYVSGKQSLGVSDLTNKLRPIQNNSSFSTDCFRNQTNIRIFVDHIDGSVTNLNVVLEFTDMSALWLTKVYKTFENDLWRKKSRLDDHGNKKWWYYCGLCGNVYKLYQSIKCHLNLHLNFYPYVCKICAAKFTGRKSATSHLRKRHSIDKEKWNDFLTS